MRRDPLIIGAGPAGAAAAIVLGRAGHQPPLLERANGPTDKVCGDFLSVGTINQCKALGVDPAALGAAPIHRVRLIYRDRVAETTLPFMAMGLSRRLLDAALLSQAKKSGAAVRVGETVRRLSHGPSGWLVQCASGHRVDADSVFLATGKHDLRDQPRTRTDPGTVGMKMYFALRPAAQQALTDTVALTLFAGGYAGLQPVEDGRTVLCIAIEQSHFQALGGNWSSLLSAVSAENRHLTNLLADARPLLARPLAVAGVPFGYRASQNCRIGLFRLGDQAAVIPSFTGDGMAIALHTGQAAADMWLAGGDAADYSHQLTKKLDLQMRFAGLLHYASVSHPTQAFLLPFAQVFPGLLRCAAKHTRLGHSR